MVGYERLKNRGNLQIISTTNGQWALFTCIYSLIGYLQFMTIPGVLLSFTHTCHNLTFHLQV